MSSKGYITRRFLTFVHSDLSFALMRLKYINSFRVCLFECEIGCMENFGEKIRRKTFLECVWLGEKERK